MHIEERYEIRGTLGKGGLGTVYKAYDQSLKREVAIKRIIPGDDGQTEEAARQMEQETGALAALQHPHIVTIYDVGTDEDGPFVVMELLKGNTLDELVEKAPLTWPDFRALAEQIMEGLIAAQDLGLLHRDLKPSNVMINWLPSGKFQAKIVDFGLAKFSPKPSSQTLDHHDSVYGSIFYMAPEQFERTALDTRTDMYAIGCVYYFALSGKAPFSGETGPQVMASHLEHRVVPLAELRPDIPKWAADWVMWHLNRTQAERPENAREALSNFIELDKPITESMSTGNPETPPEEPKPEEAPKRPRLIIPGANPEPAAAPAPAPEAPPAPPAPAVQATPPAPAVQAVPAAQPVQPVAPPQAAVPVVPPQPVEPVPPPQPVQPVTPTPPAPETPPVPESKTGPVPEPPVPQTAPQPLTPPEGAPPSVHTTSQQGDASSAETAPDAPPPAPPAPAPAAVPTAQAAQAAQAAPAPAPAVVAVAKPVATQPAAAQVVPTAGAAGPTTHQLKTAEPVGQAAEAGQTTIGSNLPPQKKGLSNGAKVTIAVMLSIVVVILGWVVLSTMSSSKINKRYNELVAIAADPTAKELPVTAGDLEILLDSVRAGSNSSRETVYRGLAIATPKGSTDVDARIAEFATTEILPDEIRNNILSRVLTRRASKTSLPYLIEFTRSTDNDGSAAAALEALATVGGEEQIDDFIGIIQFTSSGRVRIEAEKATAKTLERSSNRAKYGPVIIAAAESATDDDVRRTMLRLLGYTGSDEALEKMIATLNGGERLDTLAALQAVRNWPDDSMFEELVGFLDKQTDELIRRKTFEATVSLLTDSERAASRDKAKQQEYWKKLSASAKTDYEQSGVILGLARTEWAPWAISLVKKYVDDSNSDEIIVQAEKAIQKMQERARVMGDKDEDGE